MDLEGGEGGFRGAGGLAVPEIHLPGGGREDWDSDEGRGAGRDKLRLQRSHAIRDSVSPPPGGREERREESDGRSVVSSEGGEGREELGSGEGWSTLSFVHIN